MDTFLNPSETSSEKEPAENSQRYGWACVRHPNGWKVPRGREGRSAKRTRGGCPGRAFQNHGTERASSSKLMVQLHSYTPHLPNMKPRPGGLGLAPKYKVRGGFIFWGVYSPFPLIQFPGGVQCPPPPPGGTALFCTVAGIGQGGRSDMDFRLPNEMR